MSLNRRQFKDYDLYFVPNDGFGNHLIEGHHNKAGHVANLEWSPESGEIKNVEVEQSHQRQGLATAMFNFAKSLGVTQPKHSASLSSEGSSWKESLK